MGWVFEWLTERLFRLAEKINGAIFSFVFLWGTLALLYHLEHKAINYLGHLKHVTGNHGFIAIQIVVFLVSCVIDFILAILPFYVSIAIFYWDKVD